MRRWGDSLGIEGMVYSGELNEFGFTPNQLTPPPPLYLQPISPSPHSFRPVPFASFFRVFAFSIRRCPCPDQHSYPRPGVPRRRRIRMATRGMSRRQLMGAAVALGAVGALPSEGA